jgi:hypothetical protein
MDLELKTLGTRVGDNWKLFTRLADGFGCSAKGAEKATAFFVQAWPDTLPWPKNVPDIRTFERREAMKFARRAGFENSSQNINGA